MVRWELLLSPGVGFTMAPTLNAAQVFLRLLHHAHERDYIVIPVCIVTVLATLTAVLLLQHEKRAHKRHLAAVLRVVVTGGPNAGRKAALLASRAALEAQDYRVFTVPSVEELMVGAGMALALPKPLSVSEARDAGKAKVWAAAAREQRVRQHGLMLRARLAAEDALLVEASDCGQRAALLHRGGALDLKLSAAGESGAVEALPPAEWRAVLRMADVTEARLRRRYTAVVHLVSPAVELPHEYVKLPLAKRHHYSPATAAEADTAVLRAWDPPARRWWAALYTTKAPSKLRRVMVDNATGYDAKLVRAADAVLALAMETRVEGGVHVKED
jgi:hypothetical protein